MLDFNRFLELLAMELQRGFATCWGMGGNDRPPTADGRPQWDDRQWTMHTVGEALTCREGVDRQRMGNE
jgi:hypothetical protein